MFRNPILHRKLKTHTPITRVALPHKKTISPRTFFSISIVIYVGQY